MPKNNAASVVFPFRVTPEMAKQIDADAQLRGISRTEWLRSASQAKLDAADELHRFVGSDSEPGHDRPRPGPKRNPPSLGQVRADDLYVQPASAVASRSPATSPPALAPAKEARSTEDVNPQFKRPKPVVGRNQRTR
jgi:hypothetical protein